MANKPHNFEVVDKTMYSACLLIEPKIEYVLRGAGLRASFNAPELDYVYSGTSWTAEITISTVSDDKSDKDKLEFVGRVIRKTVARALNVNQKDLWDRIVIHHGEGKVTLRCSGSMPDSTDRSYDEICSYIDSMFYNIRMLLLLATDLASFYGNGTFINKNNMYLNPMYTQKTMFGDLVSGSYDKNADLLGLKGNSKW